MRRVVGLAIAVAAVMVAPGAASAAPQDFTSGSATYDCHQGPCGGDVTWTAHGTPADARGQARIIQRSVFIDSKQSVDCVDVDGNRATMTGRLRKPSGATDGEYYAIYVEDNGPPVKNDPEPDRIHVGYYFMPIDCTLGNEFPPLFEVLRGNVVVKDRTP